MVEVVVRSEVTITGKESDYHLLQREKKKWQRKGYTLFESGGIIGEICYQLDRREDNYIRGRK